MVLVYVVGMMAKFLMRIKDSVDDEKEGRGRRRCDY